MRDYVGCILRMVPDLTPWHLRPLDVSRLCKRTLNQMLTSNAYFHRVLQPIRDSQHTMTPRGEGNVCSVEFNLLYRVSSLFVLVTAP